MPLLILTVAHYKNSATLLWIRLYFIENPIVPRVKHKSSTIGWDAVGTPRDDPLGLDWLPLTLRAMWRTLRTKVVPTFMSSLTAVQVKKRGDKRATVT